MGLVGTDQCPREMVERVDLLAGLSKASGRKGEEEGWVKTVESKGCEVSMRPWRDLEDCPFPCPQPNPEVAGSHKRPISHLEAISQTAHRDWLSFPWESCMDSHPGQPETPLTATQGSDCGLSLASDFAHSPNE